MRTIVQLHAESTGEEVSGGFGRATARVKRRTEWKTSHRSDWRPVREMLHPAPEVGEQNRSCLMDIKWILLAIEVVSPSHFTFPAAASAWQAGSRREYGR